MPSAFVFKFLDLLTSSGTITHPVQATLSQQLALPTLATQIWHIALNASVSTTIGPLDVDARIDIYQTLDVIMQALYTGPKEVIVHRGPLPELTETLAILNDILNALSGCILGAKGATPSPFYHAVGDVRANAPLYIQDKALGPPLLACFTTARQVGATFLQFNNVRQVILSENPVSVLATSLVQACQRFTLAQLSRIVAATNFLSRDDADAMLDTMNDLFDPEEESAADEHDAASYQSILALHAAVTRDLTARSLLMPRRVAFSFSAPMPSLWLAQRIYADGARADEIASENGIIHPAFCLRDLSCLSE